MPASITHAYFAQDLYNSFDSAKKQLLSPFLKKLMMFAQGSDPLMFYHILSLKSGKSVRLLQKMLHNTDTQRFFIHLITYIKENHYEKNPEILAYLYGSITHYVLDSTIHPFVIYQTGFFDKTKKETYKYNNQHAIMESYLDMYMVQKRTGQNPYTFSMKEFLFEKPIFSEPLKNTINHAYLKTYHLENMATIYQRSFQEMAIFLQLFRYDSFGIKKFFYQTFDIFTPKKCFKMKALSYHVSLKENEIFLNNEHHTWCYPSKKSLQSRESFDELYQKALTDCQNIIQKLDQYFNGENICLTSVFTNKSYISGLDCKLDLNFKYFKY